MGGGTPPHLQMTAAWKSSAPVRERGRLERAGTGFFAARRAPNIRIRPEFPDRPVQTDPEKG